MTAKATITPETSREHSNIVTVDTQTGEILSTSDSPDTKEQTATPPELKAAAILDLSNKKFLDGLKRRNDNRLAVIEWVDGNL